MKKTTFYPNKWQLIPYSFEMNHWDAEARPVKDLILKNWYASHHGVSEMNLNIAHFAAIDNDGVEHLIADFKGNGAIPIKGLHKGEFLRSKSILLLEPGSYATLRFYLTKTGSNFIFSDGSKKPADEFQYLDFDVANGLTIKGDEAPEVILRFDLVPFARTNPFRTLVQFLGSWAKPANKYGSLTH